MSSASVSHNLWILPWFLSRPGFPDSVSRHRKRQYNSHFQPARTAFDWLCSDKDVIDAYMQDPNRGEDFTCGLFRKLIDGMAYVGQRNHIRKMDPKVPLLLISGDQDPVGGFGKGIETVRKDTAGRESGQKWFCIPDGMIS